MEPSENINKPKFSKSQMIMKIKYMTKEEYSEFCELIEDLFNIDRYHKEFLKYDKRFKKTKNIIDLENAITNLLNSKKCQIHEVRPMKEDDTLWVSYTTYPPRSKTLSYSIKSVEDFIIKYPH